MRSGALLVLILAACGSPEPEPASSVTPTVEPSPAAPAAEADPSTPTPEPPAPAVPDEVTPAPTPVPEGVCERARACCRAYVAAIPSARRPLEERGCTEMDAVLLEAGEAADEACEAAIGGWRQSLQLTGLEVPPVCAEP